jgi:hypothetical protein
MEYHQRLAALAATNLPAVFSVSGSKLVYRRSPRRAFGRFLASALATFLCVLWTLSPASGPSPLEVLFTISLLGFTLWLLRLAVKGDVIAVLERPGVRFGDTLLPWPRSRSAHLAEDGSLLVTSDPSMGADLDLHIPFRGVDLAPLASAIEQVVFGPGE